MNLKLLISKGLKIILNPAALRNCKINKTSKVCPRCELNSVEMGRYSYIGQMCFMENVEIGSFCSIAERNCIGGAEHAIERSSMSPVFHNGKNILKKNFADFPPVFTKKTVIGNDVWIGMGCYIKAGVKIGDGAVVGMGSVVTHDVPPYEIWVGNPAKQIRKRFDDDTITGLLALKWWEWPDEKIKENAFLFDDPIKLLNYR